MIYSERFDVYIPTNVNAVLKHDALLFEYFKRDGITINSNGFVNELIRGYHKKYIKENKEILSLISSILHNHIKNKEEQSRIAEDIFEAIMFRDFEKKSYKSRISIKPTKRIENVFDIVSGLYNPNCSISGYLRRIFISYSRKPIWEREQLIFAELYQEIIDACAEGEDCILTTKRAPNIKHHIIPYCMAISEDETFNYLLCEEIGQNNTTRPMTYRLNRILRIGLARDNTGLSEEMKGKLEKIRSKPQYVINDNEGQICIRMTQAGEKLYKNIYHNRPRYTKILKEGATKLYFFDCSISQAFLYFRKFEQDKITVIEPCILKYKLREFYQRAVIPLGLTIEK